MEGASNAWWRRNLAHQLLSLLLAHAHMKIVVWPFYVSFFGLVLSYFANPPHFLKHL